MEDFELMGRQELDNSNVASTMCNPCAYDGDCEQCKNDTNKYKPYHPEGDAIDWATLHRNYTPMEIEIMVERNTPMEPICIQCGHIFVYRCKKYGYYGYKEAKRIK